jgi:hypothetical protein
VERAVRITAPFADLRPFSRLPSGGLLVWLVYAMYPVGYSPRHAADPSLRGERSTVSVTL